jgi:uncharacterized protein (DUF58 family)
VTWRGAVALAVPLVLVAAGAAAPALFVAGLGALILIAITVAVDGRRASGPGALHITREHDAILSVGVANAVRVRLRGATAHARVREELPAAAHASADEWRIQVPAELRYTLTPRVRGELPLGRTVLRLEGPWRLGWRQHAFATEERVPVDADISALRVYEALARRGQLAELGVRTLRMRTEGTEFERVREAVPDDPMRAINWRSTARTGVLMATQLMPERAQPVVACLDHGRLMGVGAGELTKLDHAINAALLLMHVALHSGDRAGLLAFADTVTTTLAPRSGAAQLRRFLDAVRPLRAGEIEADYDRALGFLSQWQRRRALVVLFTDLLDPDQSATLIRQCVHLRRKHLPLVVTVRDPAIDEMAQREPRSTGDVYARAVAAGLLADRDATLQLLRRSGVSTIDADVRTLSPRLVNRYLELKRRATI